MDARERPLGAFDAADVAAVQACEFGEGFLRPTWMWEGRATQEQLPRTSRGWRGDPQGCGEVVQRREQLPEDADTPG